MKKMLISAAAVAIFFATGCSNEELVQNQQAESREFSLTVNRGTESRTVIKEGENQWDENDAVYVFSEDGSVYGVLKIDWNTVSDDGKTATFTGTVNGAAELKNVVFPAPEGDIPTPAELRIGTRDINGAEHNAPMYGVINGGSSTFEYLGGLVRLEINGVEDGQKMLLNAEANGMPVNNGGYVWDAQQGKMVLKYIGGETIVTGLNENNTVVYLPVAVDTDYEDPDDAPKANITGKLYDGQNSPVQVLSLSNVAISKNDIGNTGGTAIEVPEGILEPTVVTSFEELNKALESNVVNVILKAAAEEEEERIVTVDGMITVRENQVVTMNLNGVTLKEEDADEYYLPVIENFGDLTVENGTIESVDGAGIRNKGILTVDCNITAFSTAVYTVFSGSTTINGGTFKNTTNENYNLIDANGDKYDDGNPDMTINGGSFYSYSNNVAYNDGATGAVNGGTFKSTGWHNIYVGGTEGGCRVDCNLENCQFLESGQASVIVSWFKDSTANNEGRPNTFNGKTYEEKAIVVIRGKVEKK